MTKQVLPNTINFTIIFFNLSIFNFIGFNNDFPKLITFSSLFISSSFNL
jgi:hypothetical protein